MNRLSAGIILVCMLPAATFAASPEDVAKVAEMVRTDPYRQDAEIEGVDRKSHAADELSFAMNGKRYLIRVSKKDKTDAPVLLVRVVDRRHDPVLLEDRYLDGVLDRGLNFRRAKNFVRYLSTLASEVDMWDERYDEAINAALVYREMLKEYLPP